MSFFFWFLTNPTKKFLTTPGTHFFFDPSDRPKFWGPPFGTLNRQGQGLVAIFLWSFFKRAEKGIEKPVQKMVIFGLSRLLELGAPPPNPHEKKKTPKALDLENGTDGEGFGERSFWPDFLRPPKVSNLCSPHNTGQFYHLWEAQILTSKCLIFEYFLVLYLGFQIEIY